MTDAGRIKRWHGLKVCKKSRFSRVIIHSLVANRAVLMLDMSIAIQLRELHVKRGRVSRSLR